MWFLEWLYNSRYTISIVVCWGDEISLNDCILQNCLYSIVLGWWYICGWIRFSIVREFLYFTKERIQTVIFITIYLRVPWIRWTATSRFSFADFLYAFCTCLVMIQRMNRTNNKDNHERRPMLYSVSVFNQNLKRAVETFRYESNEEVGEKKRSSDRQ